MSASPNSGMRIKLLFGLSLLLVIVAAVTAAAYFNVTTLKESQERLHVQESDAVLGINGIQLNQEAIVDDEMSMLGAGDSAALETLEQDVRARSARADKSVDEALLMMKDNPLVTEKLQSLNGIRKAFSSTHDTQVYPLLYARKSEEARKVIFGIQAERNAKIRQIADDLLVLMDQNANESLTKFRQAANRSLVMFLALGTIALAIGIVTAWFISSMISDRERAEKKIRSASAYARSLLEASLDPLVTISPEGKIDDVNKATELVTGVPREKLINSDFSDYFTEPEKAREGYQQVIQKRFLRDYPLGIRHTSGKVVDVLYNASLYTGEDGKVQGVFAAARDVTERKRAESDLRRVMKEVQNSVNVLAPASTEILATTTQAAASAVETATAVNQTSATVEEVKQTTLVSSQKSQYVADLAQKTLHSSEAGRKSAEESIEVMNRIRDQMESVAESIVRLSEQGQMIGQIIETVNDLAEQSNLLAVNAAIEAARAGEQGRGFAVVAQEVRSLAEQSKQATAQVRAILSDIQKATGAAVLATEQGSKAVDAGVKQSRQAGESISILADSIGEAAQASTQISASSQQQLIGMDQILMAMDSIKQASVQNVTGTKQTESAAQNIHELGQKLKELVEQYRP